ncbi:MAG TPA: hypothetical protein VFW07_14900 [Parafilimonas sp.]|nr:hypothetical protein [Parafilimonas sp.]
MDTALLVGIRYDEGKKLIEQLDKTGNKYPVALWINNSEKDDWVLLIGVPNLKTSGTKRIFRLIHSVVTKNSIRLSLNDISLIDSSGKICQGLRSVIRKTGFITDKIPFFGNFINGQSFPDSIIYRVN